MIDTTPETSWEPRYNPLNMIYLPSSLFASTQYQANPVPIRISGVYEYHADFFRALREVPDLESAGLLFMQFMEELFTLKVKVRGKLVAGYIRLLRGWLFDANSKEGAVLKGWAESRFGMVPMFHRRPIRSIHCESYHDYLIERMSPRLNRNQMYYQLDLLYTFTQEMLARFFPELAPKIPLYRGVNDLNEHAVLEKPSPKQAIIAYNSLVSFSADRDIAGQFGDMILNVEIPTTKIFFCSGLLPRQTFAGEKEFLVIGGNYLTDIAWF
ncbi:NAD(+)--dinitrogen-reductase ADP-D-ribosyltransferase [Chrysiogenes arsenatis]|uniref:NAD(+)--dinitrogen-reductase ADP-D-ribosyltransferase n=1 Tax=Chrysiogenes arsenatis TaxID=309797 RepID=UPI00041B38FD|nr:NAD(+)--dinitrogen-reductase ADP-D-ribosyltransferase [Chrysiogenes arsenatis]